MRGLSRSLVPPPTLALALTHSHASPSRTSALSLIPPLSPSPSPLPLSHTSYFSSFFFSFSFFSSPSSILTPTLAPLSPSSRLFLIPLSAGFSHFVLQISLFFYVCI